MDYPKKFVTELHRTMVALVISGALLGFYGYVDDYVFLIAAGTVIVLVGVVCGIAGSRGSICPHCHQHAPLRGPAGNCPKCGQWVPYDEYSQPPGEVRGKGMATPEDPMIHGGK